MPLFPSTDSRYAMAMVETASVSLLAAFLGQLAPSISFPQGLHDELGSQLAALVAQAQAAWPELALSPEAFAAELAGRIEADPLQELAELHGPALYLCQAAGAGDAAALAELDRQIVAEIALVTRRLGCSEALAGDVRQTLRERLLVGKVGAAPKLTQYGGRGAFAGWVRVGAVREANRLMRQERQAGLRLDTAKLMAAKAGDDDPELGYLKVHYRAHFRQAFAEALASLGPKERNLLRYRYLDELNIDAIGAIYGGHRATAARWLARIRDDLLARTRAALTRTLGLGAADLDSVMRLIHSQLPASISMQLRSGGGESTPLADSSAGRPDGSGS